MAYRESFLRVTANCPRPHHVQVLNRELSFPDQNKGCIQAVRIIWPAYHRPGGGVVVHQTFERFLYRVLSRVALSNHLGISIQYIRKSVPLRFRPLSAGLVIQRHPERQPRRLHHCSARTRLKDEKLDASLILADPD